MRLANGIVIDKEKTFGVLKFSALRREVHVQNEDGTVSEEIKERTYDLKCNTQGRMIQVSVPATVPLKDYDYNAEVELINPVADTVANANYRGADVDWYVKAAEAIWEDLTKALPMLKIGLVHGRMKPQEKQDIMAAFKNAELDLLVATTVIEVGVDVPNASLMIIEYPDRPGLAQVH